VHVSAHYSFIKIAKFERSNSILCSHAENDFTEVLKILATYKYTDLKKFSLNQNNYVGNSNIINNAARN